MDDNNTITEMKAMFQNLVTNITKQFNDVKNNFAMLDARLTNIEQGGSKEIANVAKAKMEHEVAAKELEATTKQDMKAARRAFLKAGIPDFVDKLTNKLFVTDSDKDNQANPLKALCLVLAISDNA
jgi:septation ring formation regulator EzrA